MITETNNMDLVNSIIRHPDIWCEVAPKDVQPFDAPYMPSLLYFLVNETDGVIIFHQFRDGVKIHPNIIPAKRGKLAYKAVEDSIQEVFKMGHMHVYAEIDRSLTHVIRFAKTLGFALLESNQRDLFIRRNLDS